jgi:hypothetical protein
MELSMKGTVDVRQIPPAVISDSGKVRMGNFTPAFPPVRRELPNINDNGKVRMGNFTPAFPPLVPAK